MKKTTSNKTKSTKKVVTKKSVTVNGIQPLPSGSYRVRKTINGTTFDKTFTKRKYAITYRKTLINNTTIN